MDIHDLLGFPLTFAFYSWDGDVPTIILFFNHYVIDLYGLFYVMMVLCIMIDGPVLTLKKINKTSTTTIHNNYGYI